jgi:N-acetylmuramoyl-L-alanine amidase
MKFIYSLSLFLLLALTIQGQRLYQLSVELPDTSARLSFVTKKGNVYVSASEFASLTSAGIYYTDKTQKIELKYDYYKIKLTAKSQFIVVTDKNTGAQEVYQLPVSTLLIKDDLFFPLSYMIDYLERASGYGITFIPSRRHLILSKGQATGNNLPAANSPYDVQKISIEEKANGTLIRLKISDKVITPRFSIKDNKLFLFFSSEKISPELVDRFIPKGFIKSIKLINITPRSKQLEFGLTGDYSGAEIIRDASNGELIVTVHSKMFASEKNPPLEKWIFDTIVIDAGHGGKDPGAIGISGVREKDINLKIALELGKLIEKSLPGVNVVYTRKDDRFVELYKRGKIANEANGKLFISIHCNSMPKKKSSQRGFEVYLLRPGKTQDAIAIAEFENSVIAYEDNPERYKELTDENFILVSMAHSQYMRYSEKFAEILNDEWKRKIKIPAKGVKQAGFYVLVGASMPSVLIETGYISNRNDEAYLKSRKGQKEIAESILNAVIKYKEYYHKEIISN